MKAGKTMLAWRAVGHSKFLHAESESERFARQKDCSPGFAWFAAKGRCSKKPSAEKHFWLLLVLQK